MSHSIRLARRLQVGTCPVCAKRRYPDRRTAKRAARLLYPYDTLRAYACTGYWHIGHNAPRRRNEGRTP